MKLYNGDCLEVMDKLIERDVKVDMILTDPPYGTTACKWDSIIPFDEMWKRLKLLRKDNTPIVLFGSEPFSSMLRCSNIKEFKYDWIWKKSKGTGHLNAKRQPMRDIENISIFYKKQCLYIPQMSLGKPYKEKSGWKNKGGFEGYGKDKRIGNDNEGTRYPKQIIEFNVVERGNVHPTQKPVELLEYLIKTYTNEGDTILDFTMGSGSTGVACKHLNRNFIGIELDEKYFEIAKKRIEEE